MVGDPDPGTRVVLGDPKFIYVPLWNTVVDDVYAYRCTPLWQAADGQFEPIEAFGAAFADPNERLSVDLGVFDKAIEQVNRIVAAYGVVKIVIPVHLSTLLEPEQRDLYLSVCGESVWSVFDNVCFEIVEVGADISADRLASAVAVIRSYCGEIFVCLDSHDVDVLPLPDDRPMLVGRNVRRLTGGDDELNAELQRLAESAAKLQVRTYVYGIASLELTAAAIAAGYTVIGSHAIAPALEEPGGSMATDETARMLRTLMKAKSSK